MTEDYKNPFKYRKAEEPKPNVSANHHEVSHVSCLIVLSPLPQGLTPTEIRQFIAANMRKSPKPISVSLIVYILGLLLTNA